MKKNHTIKELESYFDPEGVITFIKRNFGSGKIRKEMPKLIKKEVYRNVIIGNPFPESAKEMCDKNIFACTAPLQKEIIWGANIIYYYKNIINDFIKLKEIYEYNLLLGNYIQAESTLDNIKDKYGVSVWYYEAKLLINEYKNSEKIDDSLYEKIHEESNNNSFLKGFIEEYNYRLQQNISYSHVENEAVSLIEYMNKVEPNNDRVLIDYLVYKIDPFGIDKIEKYSEIMNFERKFSLIDYYITFMRVLKKIVAINGYKYNLTINNVINILNGEIDDENIIKIAVLYNCNVYTYKNSDESIISLLDSYTKGEYEKCIEECKQMILNNKISVEVIEVLSKCIARSREKLNFDIIKGSLLEMYLDNIVSIEKREGNLQHLFNNLKKIAADLVNTKFGAYVKAILINDYNQINIRNNSDLYKEFINYRIENPLLYSNLEIEKKLKCIEQLKLIYTDSVTVNLYYLLWNKNISKLDSLDISENRYKKYYSKILIKDKKYKEAILILKELEQSVDIVDLTDILKDLIECYMNLNEIEECINIVVEHSLKNSNICLTIPLMDIIEKTDDEFSCYLNLAIFYSLCLRNITDTEENDKNLNDMLIDAYEDYLESINIKKPCELFNNKMNAKILYFLEHICTVNVMSNSIEFLSTADIEEERSKILNFLIKYKNEDKESSGLSYDKYIAEMSNISERKILRKSINEVKNNKINVNLEKIKIEINKDIRDKYTKYVSNMDFNMKSIEFLVQNNLDGEMNNGVQYHTPVDKNVNLFYTIVIELRDLFTTQLDCCLGAEIRHGKLVSQLRVPFEKEHLVTTKDRDTGNYMDNKFWMDKYNYLEKSDIDIINNNLIMFTDTMDTLFNKVKSEWIQINKENIQSNGLFNYSMSIDSLEEIRNSLRENSSFDEFVEYVFELLWKMTDKNLIVVRNKIDDELNLKIHDECINLLKNLTNQLSSRGKKECIELFNAIKSVQTTAQYNLRSITEWFKKSNDLEGQPYKISHAVNVAQEILHGMHPHSKINIKNQIDDEIKFKRRTLNNFVNMFFIILENSINHKKDSEIDVELIIKKESKSTISVEFINNTGSKASECELKKISEINNKLKKAVTDEDIISEGGTGFLKIRKILAIDLNYKVNSITLEYEGEIFKAKILFDIGGEF